MYVTYDVKTLHNSTVLTAVLYGEIDHHSATRLRAEIDAAVERAIPDTLVLDLSGVDFMDSSGLGLVMGRLRTMKRTGGSLVVHEPSDEVLRILDMAGLEKYIVIERKERKKA